MTQPTHDQIAELREALAEVFQVAIEWCDETVEAPGNTEAGHIATYVVRNCLQVMTNAITTSTPAKDAVKSTLSAEHRESIELAIEHLGGRAARDPYWLAAELSEVLDAMDKPGDDDGSEEEPADPTEEITSVDARRGEAIETGVACGCCAPEPSNVEVTICGATPMEPDKDGKYVRRDDVQKLVRACRERVGATGSEEAYRLVCNLQADITSLRAYSGEPEPTVRTLTESEKEMWRSLVRIEGVGSYDECDVDAVVPSWNSREYFTHLKVPRWVYDAVKPGDRLFARVNIGADRKEDIVFEGWELGRNPEPSAPSPPPDPNTKYAAVRKAAWEYEERRAARKSWNLTTESIFEEAAKKRLRAAICSTPTPIVGVGAWVYRVRADGLDRFAKNDIRITPELILFLDP